MDDDLIHAEDVPVARRSRLPGAGFFYPDSLGKKRAEERAKEAIDGAEVVVVTDSDADGLGCVALLRELYDASLDVADFEAELERQLADGAERDGEAADDASVDPTANAHAESTVALLAASPYSLSNALEQVAEYADPEIDLYVCDLCPDEFEPIAEPLETLVSRCRRVSWFDHHQWDDDVAAAVRDAGAALVVGESDEECTVDVALRSLEYEFPDRFRELAAVTRDHDLWLKEDPRSDDLADYAYWADPEEYVTVVGAYGVDLPDPVEGFLEERRVEKQHRIDAAVDRAVTTEVGPWTVGVTYGRCSQNEVAESLREAGADAAVIVKPAGSASIRGSDGFERAHEVAAQVQGGGHPRAAGCKPDIYDDMLDYAHHWTTEGQAAKRVILQAFERVADKADETAVRAADSNDGDVKDDE